ncbi:hypothetical protein [Streptomyces zagrosensis]|uniref:Uncharacterized protein n=1 Tax=Streptomyces zagrosensis TaxID=1042984 RepID=A0A7W9UVN3_9ACTN|nr:hypothetical protein [Streptomyces zagrosensis]MBB5932985.1 hypothetical protein [Streptomyces zagrosensis]
MDVTKTAVIKAPAYNALGGHVGHLTFDKPQVMSKARAILLALVE